MTAAGLGRRHGARARQARRRGAQRGRRSAPTCSATCCVFLLRARRRGHRRCSSAATTSRPRPACCRSGPNGDRPAFHVIGANGTYGAADAPLDAIAAATHLHLGGPEFMGGEDAAKILAHARAHGVITSADILAPGDPGLLEWIAPALSELDYLLPNDEQVLGFTGAADLEAGCRALLERGVGCVAATRGAEGALVVDADGAVARARVRGGRGGHHRLRRRVLGRLPARPVAGPRPRRGGPDGLRRRRARGAGARHGPRATSTLADVQRDVRGPLDPLGCVPHEEAQRHPSAGPRRRRRAGAAAAAVPAAEAQARPARAAQAQGRRGDRGRRARGPHRGAARSSAQGAR